jgi:glycosyltransferase involved in cell wall biosynthesis
MSSPPPVTSLISVVIPCHNYGRYLEEAFDSVLRQTRRADEIVIIDDGSDDDTSDVIARLRLRRPDLIAVRRTPARGTCITMNEGVRLSSGDLILALSADDRLSGRYLELTERALLDDPGADFAYTALQCFGTSDRWIEVAEWDPRALCQDNYVHGTSVFRRSLHERLGGFRVDFNRIGLEDWEFWVHAVAIGRRGVPVRGCWLDYRRHGTSRNRLRLTTLVRAHVKVWWLHRTSVRARDVAVWLVRPVWKRLCVRRPWGARRGRAGLERRVAQDRAPHTPEPYPAPTAAGENATEHHTEESATERRGADSSQGATRG